MEKEIYNPLISVVVISYNSSEYILDVLESAKTQTYQNIELIVSDDKSTDNTIDIAKEWIEKNKDRFVRTEVLVPEHNTGTAANYNRGLFASEGEWIKFIDADDIMFPNCLEDNVEYVSKTPDAKVVFSDIMYFEDATKPSNKHFVSEKEKGFFELDAYNQLMILLKKNHMPPSSMFMHARLLKDNPYDERYKLLEDAPKWIDLTNKGYKLYYFDKVTTGYRECFSVTRNDSRFYSEIYVECSNKYLWNERLDLIKKHSNHEAYDYQRKQFLKFELAFALFKNKKTFFTNILFQLVRVYLKLFVHYKLQ